MQAHAPLTVESLRKSYGAQTVLDGISLSLAPGEIFGLIGLNGAGKTTLIKILLNLAAADSGEASFFGVPCTQARARQAISYLPEKFSPAQNLRGMEYLSLALSYYGRRLDRDAARALALALDLDPAVLPRMVRSYSKGMGQKLGLVGALLVDLPLLILDEPMSGLDPRARIALKQALLVSKAAGKTIFFSSHILSDIEEICDRIAIIHGGRIVYLGPAKAFVPSQRADTLERAFLQAISAGAA